MNIIAANFRFISLKPAAPMVFTSRSTKSRPGTIVSKNILYKLDKNIEAFTTMYMIIQNFVRANSKKFSLNVFIVFSPFFINVFDVFLLNESLEKLNDEIFENQLLNCT